MTARNTVAATEVHNLGRLGHQILVPLEPPEHPVQSILAEPDLALVAVAGEVVELSGVGIVPAWQENIKHYHEF